jgi:hypothetical protein
MRTYKKVCAIDRATQLEDCDHPSGFAYRGRMPCTGPQVCYLCGARREDVEQDCVEAMSEEYADLIEQAERNYGEDR